MPWQYTPLTSTFLQQLTETSLSKHLYTRCFHGEKFAHMPISIHKITSISEQFRKELHVFLEACTYSIFLRYSHSEQHFQAQIVRLCASWSAILHNITSVTKPGRTFTRSNSSSSRYSSISFCSMASSFSVLSTDVAGRTTPCCQ